MNEISYRRRWTSVSKGVLGECVVKGRGKRG